MTGECPEHKERNIYCSDCVEFRVFMTRKKTLSDVKKIIPKAFAKFRDIESRNERAKDIDTILDVIRKDLELEIKELKKND